MTTDRWTDKDSREFRAYCRQATDWQLRGIFELESERAKRNGCSADVCVEIVKAEAARRGVGVD